MWLHFRDHHEISVFLWKPCNNTSSDNVIEVWELFKHYLKITAVMRQRKCRTKSLELNPGIHVGSISPSGSLDFFASLFHNIVKHLISALDVLTQMWSMSADSTEAKISYMKEQIEKRVSNYSACTGTVGFGLKEKNFSYKYSDHSSVHSPQVPADSQQMVVTFPTFFPRLWAAVGTQATICEHTPELDGVAFCQATHTHRYDACLQKLITKQSHFGWRF